MGYMNCLIPVATTLRRRILTHQIQSLFFGKTQTTACFEASMSVSTQASPSIFFFFGRWRLVFYWLSDLCNCWGHCTEKKGRTLFLRLFLLGQSLDDLLLFGLEMLFMVLAGFLGLKTCRPQPGSPEVSFESCLPSACGYVPWGSACLWTRYPSPSGTGCDIRGG